MVSSLPSFVMQYYFLFLVNKGLTKPLLSVIIKIQKRKELIKMFRYNPADPFNLDNRRNLRNTQRDKFNCGGYALGTFSWYCPHSESDGRGRFCIYDYSFSNREEAWVKTMYSVSNMILDFNGRIRMIKDLSQLNKLTERVVAFRLSSDGDFHYIRKNLNGHWYHKRGASPAILEMSEHEVFHTNWCGRYDGPIVLLAIKRF